jgi:translation initiation factor 3 subunit J
MRKMMVRLCVPIHLSVLRTQTVHIQSDWEASSDEEEEKTAPAAPVTPPKKKGTLKAKLAEKEALKAARKDGYDDEEYDEDAVLDPREKERRDKEKELNADLSNAAELFGAAALGGTIIVQLLPESD